MTVTPVPATTPGDAVPLPPLATGRMPLTSAVRLTALLVAVCVPPAKCATPAPGDEATTHVGHESVLPDKLSGALKVAAMLARLKVVRAAMLMPPDSAANSQN